MDNIYFWNEHFSNLPFLVQDRINLYLMFSLKKNQEVLRKISYPDKYYIEKIWISRENGTSIKEAIKMIKLVLFGINYNFLRIWAGMPGLSYNDNN